MTSTDHIAAAASVLEKTPLETYVPPARPSLIGLSPAELADRLGEIGVAPAQRKMRVQQLWHWMYFRGAKNFDEMTSISRDTRAELGKHFRAGLQRRHPQMAAAAAERRCGRAAT
jgi:23S rRNA (adenine2503-C2)-methyltransferase